MRVSILTTTLLLATASALTAQEIATPQALGLGGALSSTAEGFEAGLYNPARLSSGTGNFGILGLSFQGSAAPFGPDYFTGLGSRLEDAEKAEILSRVRESGSLDIHGGGGVHWLGLSLGAVALNVTSQAYGGGSVPPEMAELFLYGNVGQSGQETEFRTTSGEAEGWATTSLALSYGTLLPLDLPGRLSVGATLRSGVVHGRMLAYNRGSSMTSAPFSTDISTDLVVGRGGIAFGTDLGVNWEQDRLSTAVVVHDLFSATSADASQTTVYRTLSHAGMDSSYTQVDTLAYGALPTTEKNRIAAHWESPLVGRALVASGAYRFDRVTATSELRLRSDAALPAGANPQELALGASAQPLRWLTLRSGTMLGAENWGLAGGISFSLGSVSLDIAANRRFGGQEGARVATLLRVR